MPLCSVREVRYCCSVVFPRDAVVLGRRVRLQEQSTEESRQRTPLLQHDAGEPEKWQRQKQRYEKSPTNAPFRNMLGVLYKLDHLSEIYFNFCPFVSEVYQLLKCVCDVLHYISSQITRPVSGA